MYSPEKLLMHVMTLLSLLSVGSIRVRAVEVLSAVCVVHPTFLELSIPPLVERFSQLLQIPPPDVQLASCISSALVNITRTCIGWEVYQKLLNGEILKQLVVVCVMSCDIIAPILENMATVLSFFAQAADEGYVCMYDSL